eukprot:TRINITY_DN2139_c0_g1_i10.p1 TRINITY_DN2139_c0_g1~~TRINITY_DN2139_c0_g1_i10.p1  ORF type:complete len:238 (-),score=124.97 TRINITY_DN2139_c0_g1_i10:279-926(-)
MEAQREKKELEDTVQAGESSSEEVLEKANGKEETKYEAQVAQLMEPEGGNKEGNDTDSDDYLAAAMAAVLEEKIAEIEEAHQKELTAVKAIAAMEENVVKEQEKEMQHMMAELDKLKLEMAVAKEVAVSLLDAENRREREAGRKGTFSMKDVEDVVAQTVTNLEMRLSREVNMRRSVEEQMLEKIMEQRRMRARLQELESMVAGASAGSSSSSSQ